MRRTLGRRPFTVLLAASIFGAVSEASAEDFSQDEGKITEQDWEALYNKIASSPDSVKIHDDSSSTVFSVNVEKVTYYFSKPGNAAHPCVIKRQIVQKGADVILETEGLYAGSKTAFEALLRSFEATGLR
jgi:hypothetical protein